MLASYTIRDDLSGQDEGAIEVIVHLKDGGQRWCFFMTPAALTICGDWIDGTRIPIHYASPYMIMVAGRLDEAIIGAALRHLDTRGDLIACSMPLEAN